jgi:hypothetical protein
MPITTHRIAGITYQTESNTPLAYLREGLYALFRVPENPSPDIRQRIYGIAEGDLSSALTPEEQERLTGAAQTVGPDVWDSPLFRSSLVRSRLHTSLDQPDGIEMLLRREVVLVRDYDRREIDLFYAGEYGPEFEMADWFGGGAFGDSVQLCQVSSSSLPGVPMTVEEGGSLGRVTGLPAHKIESLPILRSPPVQSLLSAGAARADEITVCEYLDGVMIWNRTQNIVHLAYLDQQEREPGYAAEKRVANNFPSLVVAFLPLFSALMVHCGGLIRGNKAALFLALDDGGKSTALKLATDGFVLSDDQVILRKEGERFMAHATPLGLVTDGPGQAPVGALFLLKKSPHFGIERIRPADLVRAFWEDPGNQTRLLTRHLKLQAFDLFHELCHQVPAYRLSFPKDYVDWEAVDAAMV